MKKSIISLFILFSGIIVSAQSDLEKNYFSEQVKDTFKNASVVLLRSYEEHDMKPYGIYDYKVTYVYRNQYKLNDIAAINSFSTISKMDKIKRFEIKQIKPNGKEKVIYEYFDKNYPDNGYDEEEEDENKESEQIPLEDLEIGDIIDYKYEFTYTTKPDETYPVKLTNGYVVKSPYKMPNPNKFRFLPTNEEYLTKSLPMASRQVVFRVPQELKMLQKSHQTDKVFTESQKSGSKLFLLKYELAPEFRSEEYSFASKTYPFIDYAIVQTDPAKKPYYPFSFEKTGPGKEEIAAIAKSIYANPEYLKTFYFYVPMTNRVKGSYGEADVYKGSSLSKFFKAFESGVCKSKDSKLDKLNKLHEYLTNTDKLNKVPFGEFGKASILSKFCKHLGIKHQMMALLTRNQGDWADVVSPYDITWGLYIETPERPLYITEYDERSSIYSKNGLHAGIEMILFDPAVPTSPVSTKEYPDDGYERNASDFTSSFKMLKNDDYQYEGSLRGTYKGNQIYAINDYIEDQFSSERLRSKSSQFFGIVKIDNYNFPGAYNVPEMINEFHRVDSMWSLYFKDYYKQQMSALLTDDYHFNDFKVDSSKTDNDGDFADCDTSVYGFNVYFRVNNLISKTDSDSILMLNMGSLISEQFRISNFEATKRAGDLYNRNRRIITSKSEIEIPAGYKPVNLEHFNVNIQNEYWTFKTEAKFENGTITLTTVKIYNFLHLPKEKWADFVKMVQTAEAVFMRRAILVK